jgi:hypothetical protein
MNPLKTQPIQSLSSNDLDKVLEESKKTLEVTTQEKKGRGRPKKDPQASPLSSSPMMKMNNDQYKTMLAGLIKFSGEFLATGSKFEGFKLTDQEVDLLATQGSEVAAEFIPAVDSKYVKLGMFTVSAVSIYGIKYYTFMEIQKIKIAEQQKTAQDQPQ